ncbi:CocE/NonD family hydrolase [Nocardioides astragali]|uniref:CocE/NonD family hydrolase n=1 Tax=Nocardioides astragali TaxID=1776736 RepID=A0ABW2MXC7_9ACTN|nr:CocE/NonD family hydrolase [Nocardioides astragali]
MRDGTVLRADVYKPAGDGPWPVIVARTPYDKSDPYVTMLLDPLLAVRHGLIAVIQDVRGRYASEGELFVPLASEAQDGADTVGWAARMEGSTGRVGMWGPSYLGNVQWQAAAQRPPALGAIAPSITFRTAEGLTTRGGARELGLCRPWSVYAGFDALMRRHTDDAEASERALGELIAAADGLPGPTYDELPTGTTAETDPLVARLGLPTFDVAAADVSHHQSSVEVPVLNMGGWFDVFLQGTIDNFVHGGPEDRLVIGPWNHMSSSPQQGELNFGTAGSGAGVDLGPSLASLTFDWLHARLVDQPSEDQPSEDQPSEDQPSEDQHRVKIFTMGANRWRAEPDWPLERARDTRFYLVQSGLSGEVPSGQSGEESFTYDPADPVRTMGGCTLLEHPPAGTFDQSGIESRDDVLVFTSDPLSEAVEVTGRVTATILVSTDVSTTDWVVRVCDVHPDGASYNVCDGITRVAAVPGEVRSVEVDLWSTSMLFKKGHRIRVDVTSSSFPRWDRNLNTLDGPTTGEMRVAMQTVHLGSGSYVTLPIIPVAEDVL